MPAIYKTYQSGTLYGTKYLFEKCGEGIGFHRHDPHVTHNIIVLSGSVRVYGPCGLDVTLHAGDILDFRADEQAHEIAACEDQTMILNLLVNGKPPEWDLLGPDDHTGVLLRAMRGIDGIPQCD